MIKVKTFYAYSDNFDNLVNEWLAKHSNIKIINRIFAKDWTPADVLGNQKLQFYLFIEYKELRNDK